MLGNYGEGWRVNYGVYYHISSYIHMKLSKSEKVYLNMSSRLLYEVAFLCSIIHSLQRLLFIKNPLDTFVIS